MSNAATFIREPKKAKKNTVAVNLRDLKKIKEDTDQVDMPDSENGFFYWAKDFRGRDVDATFALPRLERAYIPTENAAKAIEQLTEAGLKDIKLKQRTVKKERAHLPTREELADFAEQFVEIYEGGTDISGVCTSLAGSATNPTLSKALTRVVLELDKGTPLDEAFAVQGDEKGRYVFPLGLVSACNVGIEVGATPDVEGGGKSKEALSVALRDFAEGERAADNTNRRIKSAIRYPLGVLSICGILVAVVMYKLVPKMKDLYIGLFSGKGSTELPFMTQILIDFSDFFMSWLGMAVVGILIAVTVYTIKWLRTEVGKNTVANIKIHLPVFGKFYRLSHAAETLRLLALLSAGGQPIAERFLKAAQASSNRIYRERLEHAANRFSNKPTELADLFKPDAFYFGEAFNSQLMTMGKSGMMQITFHRYARTLEKQANRQLEKVLSNIETYAIVPIAIILGFVIIALYSPILELGSRIK